MLEHCYILNTNIRHAYWAHDQIDIENILAKIIFRLIQKILMTDRCLQVWEFDQDHQRWLAVAELALPEEKGNPIYVVAWAPNIFRPYEVWEMELNISGMTLVTTGGDGVVSL
ncbi:hypothetical protein RHGRI_026489 [Rhododendron griersonianum]|nr:hypothetical protein RHGRI_026489 [Rhododendron griersonianum]KAG5531894.1 hypothetical protein RHGRI_026489 [Rhododendron griersonianum]KAG5531896.1 hypothetical protein RHGRI_026489 [Rhododendron griersonianum]